MLFSDILTRRVVVPLWAAWEGSPYLQHLRQLRLSQYYSSEQIRSTQWNALTAILKHAHNTVPFWRDRFQETGINPVSISSWNEFQSLPILSKTDIQNAGDQLLSGDYSDKRKLHEKSTSGSIGTPLSVFWDRESNEFKRACVVRSTEWSGSQFGERQAMLWGNPPDHSSGWRAVLRTKLLRRARYLDTLKMDEKDVRRFAEEMRAWRPGLLFGHAHSLYLYAEYLVKHADLRIRPNGIISTAMVLHDWQRRTIEKVFQCRVTNRYGCEEVSLIASQCEESGGLHVNAEGVYVEVIRPDGSPCKPGEIGSVIVTDLVNRAMPIIRYQVGDTAVMSDAPCPCGRGLPLLERLEGREADYVVTRDGHFVSGISLTENFAVLVPGIAQIQIVQERIDHFVFRVVKGPEFGPRSEAIVDGLVADRFGPNTTYRFDFVDRIPQEASGKYRFCISHVPNPWANAIAAEKPCPA